MAGSWYDVPNVVAASTQSRREVLAQLQHLLNDYGGLRLDTYTLRSFLNTAVMRVSSLLRKVRPDVYRSRWIYTLDYEGPVFFDTPFVTIDLALPVLQAAPDIAKGEQGYNTTPGLATTSPWVNMAILESVGMDTFDQSQSPSLQQDLWRGNVEILDFDTFSAVSAHLNDAWRQSIVCSQRGSDIALFMGSEVNTSVYPFLSQTWDKPVYAQLTVQRKPILDNLATSGVSDNLDSGIDIPDEGIPLAIEYAKNMVLTSLGKPIDPNVAQSEQISEQSFLMTVGNYAPQNTEG